MYFSLTVKNGEENRNQSKETRLDNLTEKVEEPWVYFLNDCSICIYFTSKNVCLLFYFAIFVLIVSVKCKYFISLKWVRIVNK